MGNISIRELPGISWNYFYHCEILSLRVFLYKCFTFTKLCYLTQFFCKVLPVIKLYKHKLVLFFSLNKRNNFYKYFNSILLYSFFTGENSGRLVGKFFFKRRDSIEIICIFPLTRNLPP